MKTNETRNVILITAISAIALVAPLSQGAVTTIIDQDFSSDPNFYDTTRVNNDDRWAVNDLAQIQWNDPTNAARRTDAGLENFDSMVYATQSTAVTNSLDLTFDSNMDFDSTELRIEIFGSNEDNAFDGGAHSLRTDLSGGQAAWTRLALERPAITQGSDSYTLSWDYAGTSYESVAIKIGVQGGETIAGTGSFLDFENIQLTMIPEPASLALFAFGALALMRSRHHSDEGIRHFSRQPSSTTGR